MNQTAKIREIISAIRNKDRFLVATHVRPDGDAVGALLGIRRLLLRLGKKVDAYCKDAFPPELEFLLGNGEVHSKPPQSADYDMAILVDCGDLDRVGEELAQFIGTRVPFVINIDHHKLHQPFGDIFWIEPKASSTCEMIFDLCMHLSLAPDGDLASMLYTGIVTDTGSFRFSNTTRRVFEIASILVEAGANASFLTSKIYDSTSPERLALLAQVLGTVQFHAGSKIATAELTRSMLAATSASYMDSEGFINHLRSVKTVSIAILFREGSDGLIHISFRSREGIDVATLAQQHGGGGHKQAAACRIQGGLGEVRSMVIAEAVSCIS